LGNTAVSPSGHICLGVKGLWKIFGPNAEQLLHSERRFDSKDRILEETGCVVALRDITFEVWRGEFFVIMGLSGSGKSTLIRCLLRLIEPTAGQMLINGNDIRAYDELQLMDLRRHTTSMVFQHFGLFPHRSVIDNVAYGLKVRGVGQEQRYERAREVITKVGLKGWEEYLPSALSGGMQQRVGLARALATEPEILLMDEPFSGLDPLIRRQMQDELAELQAEVQKTIVFVTHDLHEALKMGDRIAIMRDGKIIQIGTPEDIITVPSDAYVREFVQDASPAKVLTAGTIMEQPNVLLYEWQGPKAALHILTTTGLQNVFLVGRRGNLLGLVTVERLRELIKKKGNSLRDALEPDALTCSRETIVEDLFPLAASTSYPIPVVDEKGKFAGEIHISTILSSMIRRQEVDAHQVQREGENKNGSGVGEEDHG
jgi:glycine betaine/proline transport system ATP-binding protein